MVNSNYNTTECKWCKTPIYFVEQQNGKLLPYAVSNDKHHRCPLRPESSLPKHYCQYCKEEIHFDPAVKSHNDKFLPLSVDGTIHWCKENPIYKQHKLKQWLKKQGLPTDVITMSRIINKVLPPGANLSGKDSTEISQEEINKIKNRYEEEEQRLKALEDMKTRQLQQQNKLSSVNDKKQTAFSCR